MAFDFFEKEVERLQKSFDCIFGDRTVFDIRTRQLCILAICRAGLLSRQISMSSDAKETQKMTREFRRIREGLHRCFDRMAEEPGMEPPVPQVDAERVITGA